jgi:hypothetical protein
VAAGVSDKLREVSDIGAMPDLWRGESFGMTVVPRHPGLRAPACAFSEINQEISSELELQT